MKDTKPLVLHPVTRFAWSVGGTVGLLAIVTAAAAAQDAAVGKPATKTIELPFKSHDGHEMFGKLTMPESGRPRAVLIYVQTAEGATVDMKRRKSVDETFNYFDLYREKLPLINVGFFSYEGRGIRMGDKPPRFEQVDWDVYNTSTLDNNVRDVLSAVEAVRRQPGLDATPVFLIGASEGTQIAAEAAARAPKQIAGLVLYGVLATNMRENFRYIMSDGAFLLFRHNFDTDGDGKAEYEADPKKFREKSSLKTAPFEALDRDGDGFFSVDDIIALRTKPYIDAIDTDNFAVLQTWAKTSAAVVVPANWFQDHFAHKPIWSFLATLDIPVGCFHGAMDTNTPIAAVKKLEETAKQARKSKMKFHYFDELDHSLNVGEYFVKGTLPAGHQAMFEFIKSQVRTESRQP